MTLIKTVPQGTRSFSFRSAGCWPLLKHSSDPPCCCTSESYVINTTIAKSEFGTKNHPLFPAERELATKTVRQSWFSCLRRRAWLTRGQHPTVSFQKPSITWSTVKRRNGRKLKFSKFCRTNITSRVGLIIFFTSLMFENKRNGNCYDFSDKKKQPPSLLPPAALINKSLKTLLSTAAAGERHN